MSTYRLFFLDRQGRVRNSLAAEHADDAQARAWALEQSRREPSELWQGDRIVERFAVEDPGVTP